MDVGIVRFMSVLVVLAEAFLADAIGPLLR
jgi:hypothetical protein